MTEGLYPLKFKPLLKERIWGGRSLCDLLGKKAPAVLNIGESWEISGIKNDVSVIANGFLKNNTLPEIIEIYMGDLVGENVFEKYGDEFPLLIKLIDANEMLSIQVHPGDELAAERHNANGKTEMWYIIESQNDAKLINGFKETIDNKIYQTALDSGNIEKLLNYEDVKPGDVFFIPNGRVHAIGKGIILAEIQQTSDLTYRIYDWGRLDNNGIPRELHTDLALDAIDYSRTVNTKTPYQVIPGKTANILECPYFKTNIIALESTIDKDYNLIDSFVIYICVDGSFNIIYGEAKSETVKKGETVLIPAVLKNISLIPKDKARILEVYIPEIQHIESKNDLFSN